MISDTPCPRCGCHIVKTFECGCGACKDDYCGSCGRFVSLPRDEFVELGPFDVLRDAGPVPHEHSSADKRKRMEAWFRSQVKGAEA